MTDADIESLRTWASALAPAGCLRSRQVLQLLERDALLLAELEATDAALAKQIELNVALAERVAAQSELLSKRAARATDSSIPTEPSREEVR